MTTQTIVAPPKGEAGLIVLLLEEALPRYLRLPVLPAVVGRAGPVVSMQAGGSTATVRVGAREVVLEDGLAADAWVRLEGDVDALLDVATGDHVVRPFVEGRIRLAPNVGGIVRRATGFAQGIAARLIPGGDRT